MEPQDTSQPSSTTLALLALLAGAVLLVTSGSDEPRGRGRRTPAAPKPKTPKPKAARWFGPAGRKIERERQRRKTPRIRTWATDPLRRLESGGDVTPAELRELFKSGAARIVAK